MSCSIFSRLYKTHPASQMFRGSENQSLWRQRCLSGLRMMLNILVAYHLPKIRNLLLTLYLGYLIRNIDGNSFKRVSEWSITLLSLPINRNIWFMHVSPGPLHISGYSLYASWWNDGVQLHRFKIVSYAASNRQLDISYR